MIVKIIDVPDYVSVSKLPGSDYVINPYVGCPHACKYCYASFMKRFTNHPEPWGTFVDVKKSKKDINIKKLKNKKVFLSSVTDCYNHLEKEYKITRSILEQLKDAECILSISTKSNLILRDIDLLKQFKNITVSLSINTVDENFKNDMDKASSIKDRIETLKILHENNIKTVLFMSPMFPYITDFKTIVLATKEFVDEYWFENLNLRGDYKMDIMNYIKMEYPQYYNEYVKIYFHNDNQYWQNLSIEINNFCQHHNIKYANYFYHDKIVKK